MAANKSSTKTFRWQSASQPGKLRAVTRPSLPRLDDLLGLEAQRDALLKNTRAFAAGQAANHALCWGARGTGKSTLIKAFMPPSPPNRKN